MDNEQLEKGNVDPSQHQENGPVEDNKDLGVAEQTGDLEQAPEEETKEEVAEEAVSAE